MALFIPDDESSIDKLRQRLDHAHLQVYRRLWAAQLKHHPDSVEVHISDARGWAFETAEPGVNQEAHSKQVALSLSLTLQYQCGVFYTCHVGKSRGFRFGVHPSEYISGFGRY